MTLYFAWLSPHHSANGLSRAGDFPRRWLARMQGEYYSRGKVTLEPLKSIGAAHEPDCQAALAAFQRLRGLALAQATR